MCNKKDGPAGPSAGFSLIELMIALGVTLVIMVISAQLLAASLNVRARENARAEAIADVQRGLQTMSREIGNAGLGLRDTTGLGPPNGIHPTDSDEAQIRVRANLNAFSGDADTLDTNDAGSEDVVFAIINNFTGGEPEGQRLITRQDVNANRISSLANRVDSLRFDYLNPNGTVAASPAQAARVRITVGVTLRAVGTPGRPGYQPQSRTQVVSDVSLRNRLLTQ
jgi:prepilin-type N-terminal cleavage/methylation domain-containing protein